MHKRPKAINASINHVPTVSRSPFGGHADDITLTAVLGTQKVMYTMVSVQLPACDGTQRSRVTLPSTALSAVQSACCLQLQLVAPLDAPLVS